MIALGIIASCLAFWNFHLLMQYLQLRSLSLSERILFAAGGAIGLQSLTFFMALIIFGSIDGSLIFFEMFLFGTLCLFIYFKRQTITVCSVEPHKVSWLGAILAICFAGSLLQWSLKLLKLIQESPHGRWDAWAIWNMRSRILLRSEEDWRRAFDSIYAWSHPDYPLLLPTTITRIWNYIGFETQWVPSLLGIGFMTITILLLFFGLRTLTSLGQAALMGIVLMMFPEAILHSGSQFADTPLAFYFLSTVLLFTHYDHTGRENLNYLFLSGLFAGAAAWTKNEGLLLIVILIIIRAIFSIRPQRIRQGMYEIGYFISGILPSLLARAYQGTLVSKNDLLAQQKGEMLAKLCDWGRYQFILDRLTAEFLGIGNSLLFILIGLFLFFPVHHFWRKRECMIPIITFIGMICGYFGVYLITTHDLRWHLGTSLNRLLYQLWPLLVFALAMLIKTPEAIFKDPVKESSLGGLWYHLFSKTDSDRDNLPDLGN